MEWGSTGYCYHKNWFEADISPYVVARKNLQWSFSKVSRRLTLAEKYSGDENKISKPFGFRMCYDKSSRK